jgi:hypothetical protein
MRDFGFLRRTVSGGRRARGKPVGLGHACWAAAGLFMMSSAVSASPAPEFVGHSFDLQYDNGFRVVDTFGTGNQLHFEVLSAPTPGRQGAVRYNWQRVGPHLYVIYWTEADGGTVVHVDDFKRHISRSYYTPAGKPLVQSKATIVMGQLIGPVARRH